MLIEVNKRIGTENELFIIASKYIPKSRTVKKVILCSIELSKNEFEVKLVTESKNIRKSDNKRREWVEVFIIPFENCHYISEAWGHSGITIY